MTNIGKEHRILGLLLTSMAFMACGGDVVTVGEQDFEDFEEWGSGIDGFTMATTADTNTSGPADSSFDGAYAGTYELSMSYNGYTCTFSGVSMQVLINGGEMNTPFMTSATTTCDLSFGSNTYSPQVYFEGTVTSGGVLTGTLSEDSAFVYEASWTGMGADLGGGALQIVGQFNQEVAAIFPGNPTLISGSFTLNKQ